MENQFIINAMGIGGMIFVGLILFWFVFVYLKRRLTVETTHQGLSSTVGMSSQEKRRNPRVAISWPALLEHRQWTTKARLKDISCGGAFVICQNPLALQDQFKITIDLPKYGPLPLNAEVIWSNINAPPEKVVNRGMGIRFINNDEKARQQLQRAIDTVSEKPQHR